MPLTKILDLGMHPYADSFIPNTKLEYSEPIFPLQVGLNDDTGEIALLVDTNARDRYNLYEYSYTSSNSKFSRDHWDKFAKDIVQQFDLNKDSKVLEIGSNDGYLMKQFLQNGVGFVKGIDASESMVLKCRRDGLHAVHSLFGSYKKENRPDKITYDLIVANNVVNHANDIHDFFLGIKQKLSLGGTFIFELPYWLDTIKSGHIDQVYHEHVRYFTAKYTKWLCEQHDLELIHVDIINYHGGSIRCWVQHKIHNLQYTYVPVEEQIKLEEEARLFDYEFYAELQNKLNTSRIDLISQICKYKQDGYTVVGIGAAAKGNTLLNMCGLNELLVSYVTDGSPDKIGKVTPLSRIPITTDDVVKNNDKIAVLFLAWNIRHILEPKLKELNPNIKVIEHGL